MDLAVRSIAFQQQCQWLEGKAYVMRAVAMLPRGWPGRRNAHELSLPVDAEIIRSWCTRRDDDFERTVLEVGRVTCLGLAMPIQPNNDSPTHAQRNASPASGSRTQKRTPAARTAVADAEQARINEKKALEFCGRIDSQTLHASLFDAFPK